MEDVLIRKDRVPSDAVQERLEHALPASYHSDVLLRLALFHGIVTYCLLRRNWRDNKSGVKLDKTVPQGFKL